MNQEAARNFVDQVRATVARERAEAAFRHGSDVSCQVVFSPAAYGQMAEAIASSVGLEDGRAPFDSVDGVPAKISEAMHPAVSLRFEVVKEGARA